MTQKVLRHNMIGLPFACNTINTRFTNTANIITLHVLEQRVQINGK